MSGPSLEVKNLTRHFQLRRPTLLRSQKVLRAVEDVSFTVPAGKMLGIVGESGCGKSTTAKLILGLIMATSGTVRFDGDEVSAKVDSHWRQFRRRAQMIYQDPMSVLDRRLTAAYQIEEPLIIHHTEMTAEDRRDRVSDALAQVGLRDDLGQHFPHELSGGQRQRVVVARALVLNPDLLICDEPVSALDVSVQAQVLNLFEDIRAARGFTSVFISHDLKVVRQIADSVAVMYLGRIVELGAPDDVFHAPAHPYTEALVSAIPDPRRRHRKRIVLAGDPPSPTDIPTGCAFHTRCPIAMTECRVITPNLLSRGGRAVACHRVHPPDLNSAT